MKNNWIVFLMIGLLVVLTIGTVALIKMIWG